MPAVRHLSHILSNVNQISSNTDGGGMKMLTCAALVTPTDLKDWWMARLFGDGPECGIIPSPKHFLAKHTEIQEDSKPKQKQSTVKRLSSLLSSNVVDDPELVRKRIFFLSRGHHWGVGALYQCPLEVVLSMYGIYADVRNSDGIPNEGCGGAAGCSRA